MMQTFGRVEDGFFVAHQWDEVNASLIASWSNGSLGESDSLRSRINKWFSRRGNTEWSEKELKALKMVVKLNTPESDLQLLDARYESKNKYRRKDILTLLNNWNTEIDRCKSGDDESQQSLPIQSGAKKQIDWRDSL